MCAGDLRINLGRGEVLRGGEALRSKPREYDPLVLLARNIGDRAALDRIVERSLCAAAPWDEVKDGLNNSALALSGGQQQLCIAGAGCGA